MAITYSLNSALFFTGTWRVELPQGSAMLRGENTTLDFSLSRKLDAVLK